jgi:death-on-curing family protein
VRDVAHTLAEDFNASHWGGEPMPSFKHCDRNKLGGALLAPAAGFGGVEQYPTLEEKAAVLLYHVARAHAWPNGNKRMALVLTMLFLAFNDRWLIVIGQEAYELVCLVADKHDRSLRQLYIDGAKSVIAVGCSAIPAEMTTPLENLRKIYYP